MNGVLAPGGWQEAWRPSPKVDPGPFGGQRHGWKTPKRTLGGALLLLLCMFQQLGDLGVCRSVERDCLSVLSIYPGIVFSVCLFVSSLIRDILLYLCVLILCSCLLVVLVTLSVLASWLAKETPASTPDHGKEVVFTKSTVKRMFVCVFNVLLCLYSLALHNIYFTCSWHDVACLCWKCG